MVEQIEALLALAQSGTMAAAGNRLRVTASAVSKRISLLEEALGYKLIEPRGRMVQLTPAALRLVQRLDPLLAEMKSALTDEASEEAGEITLGVSESILSSWGASLIAKAARQVPQLKIRLYSHRSPLVMERVRSGEYVMGICAGLMQDTPEKINDLRSEFLLNEEMVLIPSLLEKFRVASGRPLEVISIEPHAGTWGSLKPQLKTLKSERDIDIKVESEVQSYACIVQMAKAGMGHGLVPRGIAKSMGVPEGKIIALPKPGLQRPVSLIARKSTMTRSSIGKFIEAIKREVSKSK